jgi:hypothetical protein
MLFAKPCWHVWAARWARLAIVWLWLALIAAGCGAASPGRLLVADEAMLLDRARVEAAAGPLLVRGAALAVIAVPAGDDSGADFTRQLDAAGLLHAGQIAPAAIALYVSFAPRYSEIRSGTDWSPRLPNEALRAIRLETLNPALRAGAASEGVAAALAALDARIEAGALGGWGSRVVWALLAGIAMVIVLTLAYNPLSRRLGRARRAWLASAPGRLAVRLWERSPPGRALERRRIMRQIDWSRQRLGWAASEARKAAAKITLSSADLESRLHDADARNRELEQCAPDDPDLLPQLGDLRQDYQRLSADIAARQLELQRCSARVQNSVKEARTIVERVANSFESASKASNTRRKRAARFKREISDAGRQRLAEQRGALEQIDQQRAALDQMALPALELIERQKRLASDYDTLKRDAIELWKAELPRAYQAYLAAQTRARLTAGAASYTSDSYSSPAAPSDSSYNSNNSFDYGSPSEPSSDGGSW